MSHGPDGRTPHRSAPQPRIPAGRSTRKTRPKYSTASSIRVLTAAVGGAVRVAFGGTVGVSVVETVKAEAAPGPPTVVRGLVRAQAPAAGEGALRMPAEDAARAVVAGALRQHGSAAQGTPLAHAVLP
mmetsp:Transcript_18149/g.36200  ORF Transcript_18149/g.36200 Transcript_18149/m.36200 type:complete len:128 (-) Transcript_18149:133-516(-)